MQIKRYFYVNSKYWTGIGICGRLPNHFKNVADGEIWTLVGLNWSQFNWIHYIVIVFFSKKEES